MERALELAGAAAVVAEREFCPQLQPLAAAAAAAVAAAAEHRPKRL